MNSNYSLDTSVTEDSPDYNWTGWNQIYNGGGAGSGSGRYGFYTWNTSNVTNTCGVGATCINATWCVTYITLDKTYTIDIYRVLDLSNIFNVVWNNKPSINATPWIVSLNITGVNNQTCFNMTRACQSMLDNQETHMNFSTRPTDNSVGNNQQYLHSREASSIGARANFSFTCAVPSPPTQPRITHINLTSEGGAGQLVNLSDTQCIGTGCVVPSTSDTTPTFTIRTDISANCSIGRSNLNYTGMGSARTCNGTGSTEHVCSLISADELVYEDSYVYFGCSSTTGLENVSSTSGAVKLTITGLESAGDSSIGLGVHNALLSSYTNYTSQQISARNYDGSQSLGRFDWVAKKGTKTWAFNYVTKGEAHVRMFNITPSFYVLEMGNISSANITLGVETLINATR